MILSPKQDEAARKISAWMKTDVKRFVLAGFAGTGKSTLAKQLSEDYRTHFCAYTGKAANVLREKGNDTVTTIHGALYKIISDENEEKPRFALDRDSVLQDAQLVIVDEYSMLPDEIIKDIERVSRKVLYLGDPEQLPPVSGNCTLQHEYFLDEIHRQALESPILRAATLVRTGGKLQFCDEGAFVYKRREDTTPEDYEAADQIIVGLNKTRIKWNNRFRQKLNFDKFPLPQRGDKLICIKNNHEIGLFNGMIGYANRDSTQISFQTITLSFESYRDLQVWDGTFKQRKDPPIGKDKMLERFDYAYAITCHKSQGSEFDNLLVYNEPFGTAEERRRWAYTALTRAKKRCLWVEP